MSKFSKWRKHPIREFSLWLWQRRWNNHTNITAEYNQLLLSTFQDIAKTRPLPCNPEAGVELHSLMGHYHLNMYLTAVKSLLRFTNNVAVVAHDGDGDLTEADRQLLRTQIPGIRIIERAEANQRLQPILQPYPRCQAYRNKIVNALELLDHTLLAQKQRIVTMNSDVLFLQRPQELVEWINSDSTRIIYTYETQPAQQQAFLQESGAAFPPHVTLALACFCKDIMNLKRVEERLRSSRILQKHLWPAGQNLLPLLFDDNRARYSFSNFDPATFDSSGVFRDGAIFRHYWSSVGTLTTIHASDAKRIMAEIG